jgi:NADPH:quinone reductase-like Zn-dependent oxidoreductase
MAMMGGMGRTYNGGYAEYTCVPAAQVIPFVSALDWVTLGAIPEMLQTAHGSLTIGLDARPNCSFGWDFVNPAWPPLCWRKDAA